MNLDHLQCCRACLLPLSFRQPIGSHGAVHPRSERRSPCLPHGEIDSQRDTSLMVDRSVNHQVVRFQLPFPEPCMHLSMHTALQRCVLLKLFPSVSSNTATAFYAFSCTPSPCIGHCPDHLSTMGAPSPYISRYVGDPQVPTSSCSVRRSPVRWLPPSLGAATEGIFTRSLNFTE
jgi:hypothetical protein